MNVHDHLKDLSVPEIREVVQENTLNATVAMYNVYGNLNLGSIIRTANFLGFKEVLYFGRRKYDKRGAVGTYHYTNVTYFEDEDDFLRGLSERDLTLVALENNVPHTTELRKFHWPHNPCLLIGEENAGIPEAILENCYATVEINGLGSVRSLNVSAAAACAMYELSLKASE